MSKRSLRPDLLSAGLRVMFRSGYHGSGVREIAAAAGAPQGSFTNHFASKEAFAVEVLDLYFEHVQRLVQDSIERTDLSPRQRLHHYLDVITGRLAADHFERGCLIGDFSLETSQASEALRARLKTIFETWRQPFAQCIGEAQSAGEIETTFGPEDLAEFLLASWQGAILRAKVERSAEPLERFKRIAFQTVFREGATS